MREKTNSLSFQQVDTNSHRSRLEARNLDSKKKRYCTIPVAKTKALISFAVTAMLICTFVFAYDADCWFSHGAAHMIKQLRRTIIFKNIQEERVHFFHHDCVFFEYFSCDIFK